MNSKWINELSVKWKIIKLLQYKIGESLSNLVLGDDFLDKTPEAQPMKEKMMLDFVKMKNFWSEKDTVKRMKRHITDWKKYL